MEWATQAENKGGFSGTRSRCLQQFEGSNASKLRHSWKVSLKELLKALLKVVLKVMLKVNGVVEGCVETYVES